ncbi:MULTISPECIES: DUF2247 family protein [Pseudomonas]|uniref:DUF2247 family protein n=1 Tax=Pseudomonas TaxID=286 RepID=UPI000CEEE009|nr:MULTISPECIES: DUF2247 family protein [Pseudomonas]MBI6819840.1 DUF2247 family protein [Pseudomonas syringae]MBI6822353.1 DUF2247 family protein [Pseudomonas syringae]MBP1121710.1 hypothetical protein [Pseudomonas sp. PvP028]MCH5517374.1 DUF2247 family protein [Pseudomonas syringae pv. syringae]MEE1994839.1 DUF2247 family protein [Pseudomonas syringae pv. syringae]
MYFPTVPNTYICNCICLNWLDALWGYERKLVGWSFVVELANFKVSNGSDKPLELDLVFLGEFDIQEIEKNMYLLAGQENELLGLSSQKKWLFIALKWLFENKDSIADPLGVVELIYEEFDFPFEIEGFVRYMPSRVGYKPEEHTDEQNLERIFSNWQHYLESMGGI